MIEAPHYSAAGAKKKGGFSLPGDYFDGTINRDVLHQAVKTYLNNQRQGTAKTRIHAALLKLRAEMAKEADHDV